MTATPWNTFPLRAGKYIARIRNRQKKQYAELYYQFLTGHRPFDHGGGPDDPSHGFTLSYMARQAVRLELDDLRRQERRPRP